MKYNKLQININENEYNVQRQLDLKLQKYQIKGSSTATKPEL